MQIINHLNVKYLSAIYGKLISMFNEQLLINGPDKNKMCSKLCVYERHLWIDQPLNSILTNSPGVLDGDAGT